MKPTTDKKLIKQAIQSFFATRTGTFRGYDLLNHVKKQGVKRAVYPDTVLRYMRELSADGLITYEQVGAKRESEYKICSTT